MLRVIEQEVNDPHQSRILPIFPIAPATRRNRFILITAQRRIARLIKTHGDSFRSSASSANGAKHPEQRDHTGNSAQLPEQDQLQLLLDGHITTAHHTGHSSTGNNGSTSANPEGIGLVPAATSAM